MEFSGPRLAELQVSAAREIVPDGENFLPQPLRTVLEPDGISSLQGLAAVRVSQANQLYSFCGGTFDKCHRLGKARSYV